MIPTLLRRMLNLRRSVFVEILRTAQDFPRCHLVATVENNSLTKKQTNKQTSKQTKQYKTKHVVTQLVYFWQTHGCQF